MAYLDERNARPLQQKFLDLMPLKLHTKEEVMNALHKLPEMKLRPEKLSDVDAQNVADIRSWEKGQEYPYVDPVPQGMKELDIRELSAVNIDWKMLTLQRPSTQNEVNIFSRIVSLDKLMLKSIIRERTKKEELNSVYLKASGRLKVEKDNSYEKADEFSYEFYSRFYGSNERGQTLDEIPKPSTAEQKPEQSVKAEILLSKEETNDDVSFVAKSKHPKSKSKKKRKRGSSKKPKLRKRKVATGKVQAIKKKVESRKKPNDAEENSNEKSTGKKGSSRKVKHSKSVGKKSEPKKTLVQMTKTKELREQKAAILKKSSTNESGETPLKSSSPENGETLIKSSSTENAENLLKSCSTENAETVKSSSSEQSETPIISS